MIAIAVLIVCMLCDCFKSRRRLATEILVLRHQLNVLQQRTPRRLHLRWADRALFIWLYRRCPRILDAITIVRPGTVVVLGEAHLRRILTKYAAYYNELRTHRSLDKDAPIHRAIQNVGRIISAPVLGGLHHHYCRI
jgi:hypothetical protein